MASSSDGDGQPRAEQLDDAVVLEHEAAEDHDHDRRGRGDDPRRGGQTVGHGVHRVAGLVVLLLDAGEEEDLVVHGQAEHDGEEHHRDERLDGPAAGDADQVLAPAPLEDGDDDAVGRGDGQHVHDDRLDRHQQRPEDHHQEEERQGQHDAEEEREPPAEVVGEVDAGRDHAGDVHVEVGARPTAVGDAPSSRRLIDQILGGFGLGPVDGERPGRWPPRGSSDRWGWEARPRRRHRSSPIVLDHGQQGREALLASADSPITAVTMSGPLKPGTEAVGEQVVGPSGGGLGAHLALVGEPEPQRRQRGGEHQQQERGADGHGPRVALDEPAPPVGERLAERLGLAARQLPPQEGDEEAGDEHDQGEGASDEQRRDLGAERRAGRRPRRPAASETADVG